MQIPTLHNTSYPFTVIYDNAVNSTATSLGLSYSGMTLIGCFTFLQINETINLEEEEDGDVGPSSYTTLTCSLMGLPADIWNEDNLNKFYGKKDDISIYVFTSLLTAMTDVQNSSPQFVMCNLTADSLEVDSDVWTLSNTTSMLFIMCDNCFKTNFKGKQKEYNHGISNDMWPLDSGASAHFTNNIKNFTEYQPFPDA